MPAFFLILLVSILCIFVFAFFAKKNKPQWLQNKIIDAVIFGLSLISFLISLVLLVNLGIYADNYGSSPVLVAGGWFWLYTDWIRLGVLFLICLITGLRLISKKNK